MADRWDELKHRVEAKRKKLQAEIEQAKADGIESSNHAAKQAREKLKQLGQTLENGWDDLSEATAAKLNQWLK